ncbi:MAG TPA: alpha/beta hydrolase [Chthoniobacteraceae bacterium]|jgi:acetyl esterase/lipase
MRSLSIALFLALHLHTSAQEKVVRIYEGPAPGSENWTQVEREIATTSWGGPMVVNVVNPTLTVVPADPASANGTAVVIAPGGGFHMHSINSEGMDVAKSLAGKGITSFVLRYRLVETKTDDPAKEMGSRESRAAVFKTIVPLASGDGQAAISHVRAHAQEYGVDPKRIGIMGFSAGGTVACAAAYHYTAASRPDFVAPIYAAAKLVDRTNGVPADAPPMFILAATDDPMGLARDSVELYSEWIGAKKSAELHLFATGGHGFGMKIQNKPTDGWIERFTDWLSWQGLLKK